jgi:glucose-6-phosphate 1-dehydrogenase
MAANKRNVEPDQNGIAFVIFGVTGDLTYRKLVPALYQLIFNKRLNDSIYPIGFARRDWDDDHLRTVFSQAVEESLRGAMISADALKTLLTGTHYVCSNFDDPEGYQRLGKQLDDLGVKNVLFYLATPPDAYPIIIQNIGTSGLQNGRVGWTRIVIEKPYGRDLNSAVALEEQVHKVFREDQIYRIDHYLGKDTVQNILVLRFANGIFEPLWNSHYVDHIQIMVSESVGVGTRAGYYDTAGVIRDIFQNHMLQLLSLVAMEVPVAFQANAVRDEKVKVLHALRPISDIEAIRNTFRAQYVSGWIDSQRVPGYKEEVGGDGVTATETYLAARLFVDNWRWAGVPFYVRSGKRLPNRLTEIAIQFKQVPLPLFNWRNMAGTAPNVLILTLQPNEGITLTFGAKAPGQVNEIAPVKMQFSYKQAFGSEPPDAYERLLLDIISGDATLFTRSDEVLAAWSFTTRILEAWQKHPVRNLPVYEAGTWGPPGADEFIERDNREWQVCCMEDPKG